MASSLGGWEHFKYFPPPNLWLVGFRNSFHLLKSQNLKKNFPVLLLNQKKEFPIFDCQPRSTGDMGWPSSSVSRWEITFFFKYFFTCDPGNPIGPSWLWLARTLRARSIARNPHSRPGHLHLEGTKQASCGHHQRLTSCVSACVDHHHDHREFDFFQLIWFHLGKLWPFLWTMSTIAVASQLFDFFTHLLFSCFCWRRWQGDHVWVFVNGQEILESVFVTRWPCLVFW